MPVILTTWLTEIRRIAVQSQSGQTILGTLFENTQHKTVGRVAQVVEYLLSKHKTQSSNPVLSKEQKKGRAGWHLCSRLEQLGGRKHWDLSAAT
jgi:hypothetical protein